MENMKIMDRQIESKLHLLMKISLEILIVMIFLPFATANGQGTNRSVGSIKNSEKPGEFISVNLHPENGKSSGMTDDYPYPPIWEIPESSRIEPHILIVTLQANPRINEIPLQEGDYIGAFFVGDDGTLVCGGSDYWKADSNIVFGLTGDDPQTTAHKEGFSYGEVIVYRIFSFTTMKEYTVTNISFDTSPGSGYISGVKWYPLALSSVTNLKAAVTFDVYATANPNTICLGGSSQLSAVIFVGPGGPYTYEWTSNPAGFSSTLQNPVVTPVITTQYLLTAHSGTLTSQHSVTVIVNELPMANAGDDGTVCFNQTYQLTGTAQNYSALNWTTSGNGTFSSTSSLSPVYTPGTQDPSLGQITISLEAVPLSPCNPSSTDNLTLTVFPIALINAGADKQVCGNEPIFLDATTANYATIQWTTSGTGTFTQPNLPQTFYQPGNNDVSAGTVTLTLCATTVQPCVANVCDAIGVTFFPGPIATAPASRVICENQTANLSGFASNYSSTLWTTSGDGTFNNPAAFSVTYFPGINDKITGVVTATFTAFPISPCSASASKNTAITIRKLPQVNAGIANPLCVNSNLHLNGTAGNYSSLLWSTLGDGTFSNTTILNPYYFPGPNDNTSGQVNLVLKASSFVPCTMPAYDTLVVTITDNPMVQILTPDNQQLCQVQSFQLEAQAESYSQVEWTSDGDGTYDDPSLPDAVYFPGNNDLVSGQSVKLTLTAFPISPCAANSQAFIHVTFTGLPTVYSGEDATLCQLGAYQLDGSAQNQSSVMWATTGDGTFSNPAILDPFYIPGIIDIIAGTVTLTLTAFPFSPCTTTASDDLVLTQQISPVVYAGSDATIIENESHSLSATAGNYAELLWQTSGDGYFNDDEILNPVYYPGQQDIENSMVELTLTAWTDNSCQEQVADFMTLTIMRQQIIQLTNGWNSLSSFVFPPNQAFDQVMAPISNNLIIAKNMSQVYWSAYGINTIGNFETTEGYMVKMSGTSDLPITGFQSQNKTIQLIAGWNILPVISGENVDSQTLLTQLGNQLIIVTEIAGSGIIWPAEGVNSIPYLIPGKAYMVKVNSACSFTYQD